MKPRLILPFDDDIRIGKALLDIPLVDVVFIQNVIRSPYDLFSFKSFLYGEDGGKGFYFKRYGSKSGLECFFIRCGNQRHRLGRVCDRLGCQGGVVIPHNMDKGRSLNIFCGYEDNRGPIKGGILADTF